MTKHAKRLLALLLVLTLCVGLFPGAAFAEGEEGAEDPVVTEAPAEPEQPGDGGEDSPAETPAPTAQPEDPAQSEDPGEGEDPREDLDPEEDLGELPEDPDAEPNAVTASGTCGDNLTWVLDDGTLTVSGSGAMPEEWTELPNELRQEIRAVVLEPGVTSIGSWAFCGCSALERVSIPEGVTSIGQEAFRGCYALESVKLPASLTFLGDWAFSRCSSLVNVTIPEGVTSIGDSAFSGCGFTSVTLPASLTELGRFVFSGSALQEYLVAGGNPVFSSRGGMLYDKAGATLLSFPCSRDGSAEIPAGTTAIGASAFYGSALTEITIPEGVTSIGDVAFGMCQSLTSITLPASVTSIGLGIGCYDISLREILVAPGNPVYSSRDGMLYDKAGTTLLYFPVGCGGSATLPAGTKAIGRYAFHCGGTVSILTVPAGLTRIDEDAFYDSSVSVIRFLGSAPSIDETAFNRAVTIYYPAGDASWESCVGQNYGGSITWVAEDAGTFPVSGTCGMNPDGSNNDDVTWTLTADGTLTVSGCGDMRYYNQSTGDAPWWSYADYIQRVVIEEGVTSIGSNAFRGCRCLQDVSLPEGLAGLGAGAFNGCTALRELTIPEGVTSIGQNTFYNCSALASVQLPSRLIAIYDNAFYGCHSLKALELPANLIRIGSYAFAYAGLDSITIPASVTSIGDCAFMSTGLRRVTVEEGATGMGSLAFDGCSILAEVTLPKSLSAVNYAIFSNCFALKDLRFRGTRAEWQAAALNCVADPYSMTVHCTDGDLLPKDRSHCGDDLTWRYSGSVLTVSGSGPMWSFRVGERPWEAYADEITVVVLQAGVTSVGGNAFSGCWNLKTVVFPEGLKSIGVSAFSACPSLSSAPFPSTLESIGENAFYSNGHYMNDSGNYTTAYLDFTLPQGLKRIGVRAFYGRSMRELRLPESLEACGAGFTPHHNADGEIDQILIIPRSLADLSVNFFLWAPPYEDITVYFGGTMAEWQAGKMSKPFTPYCTVHCTDGDILAKERINDPSRCGDNLTWTLDDGTLTISGTGDMWDYTYGGELPWFTGGDYWTLKETITRVVVEPGVTSIGNYAFHELNNLTSVTLPAGVTRIGDDAFSWCYNLESINIPEGVTSIGDDAFNYCTSLRSVRLPESLEEIGDYAFAGCRSLSLELPHGLKRIGSVAFSCGPTYLVIPASVEEIGSDAFGEWDIYGRKVTVVFEGHAPKLGAALFRNSAATVYYPGGDATWAPYVGQSFGGSTLWIARDGNGPLDSGSCGSGLSWSLSATGTLTITGSGAMQGYSRGYAPWARHASGIQRVEIGEGVTTIGNNAFYNCFNLIGLELPASLQRISAGAFAGCTGLSELRYGGLMDALLPLLHGQELPAGLRLTALDGSAAAFGSCGDALDWWLGDDGALTVLGSGGMNDFGSAAEAPWAAVRGQIKALVLRPGLTSIGSNAFSNLLIPELTIPAGVTAIGSAAFSGCVGLKTIRFEGAAPEIAADAFSGVTAKAYYPGYIASWTADKRQNYGGSLTWTADNPEGYVDSGTCGENLTWLLTADGTLTISGSGEMAEYDRDYYWGHSPDDRAASPWEPYHEQIRSVVIEEGVTSVSTDAFYGYRNIASVSLPASLERIGDFAFTCCWSWSSEDDHHSQWAPEGAGVLSVIRIPANSRLKSIGIEAFEFLPNLSSFRLPAGLESIGDYAFGGTGLTSVRIPDSVTALGVGAFQDCGSLRSATLPAGLTAVPAKCFRGCGSLTSVTIPEGVTRVGSNAFYGCNALQSIGLPASLTEIGAYAFYNSALEDFDLSHVEKIGDYAFAELNHRSDYSSYLTLDLRSVKELGRYAFSNSYYTDSSTGYISWRNVQNIYTVRVGSGLTALPEGAFQGASINSIALPAGLTKIGPYAFRACALGSITLPAGLTEIGSFAFAISDLGRVEIPAGVTELNAGTFDHCGSLKIAVVPASVLSIAEDAFAACPELTIYGASPSAAKTYAAQQNIPFKTLDKAPKAVTGIKLSQSEILMDGVDSWATLKLTLEPADADPGLITWTVTPRSVAGISTAKDWDVYTRISTDQKTMNIRALDVGEAVVTVYVGELSASCAVTVPAVLKSLSLPQNVNLIEGETLELPLYPYPEKADLSTPTITWKSSSAKVLSVTPLNNGESAELAGLAAGTATVTVTVGKISAKTTVTVLPLQVDEVNLRREGEDRLLNGETLCLPFTSGAKFSFTAEKEPAEAKAAVKWSSSNTKVATVDAKGVVTLKGGGTAVITAKASDKTGVSASFTLCSLNLKPVLSLKTATVNSYLEAGTPLEITPAAGSYLTGASLVLKKGGDYVPLDALELRPTFDNGYELLYPGVGKVSYSAFVCAEVYSERLEESFTFYLPLKINVVNTAPKVSFKLEKVNTFYPGHSFAVTPTVTGGVLKEYILAENSNPNFELDENGDLILSAEGRALVEANPKAVLNKLPVVFQVWCQGGKPDAPLTVSVKPAVTYAKPTVKLGALRFNRFYTDREYPLTLTVTNGEVESLALAADSSPYFDLDPAAQTLSLNRAAWAALGANPKFAFTAPVVLEVSLTDVDEVFRVSAKPTVSRTVPKLYLADADTGAKLSALTYNEFLGRDTARFAIFDGTTKEPVLLSGLDSSNELFQATVTDSARGIAELQKLESGTPAKTVLTVQSDAWDAPLTLSAPIKYEKQPAVSFTAVGKLDLLLRGSSSIVYTPKLSNATGAEVMDIELESVADAKGNPLEGELFQLRFHAALGTAELTALPGAALAKAKYQLIFRTTLELDGVQSDLTTKVTVTPTQSKLALKTWSTKLTLTRGDWSYYAYIYPTPEGAQLKSPAVTGTLPAGLSVSFEQAEDRNWNVIFTAAEDMKPGTYTVKISAEAFGAAAGTAPSVLSFKVTVK